MARSRIPSREERRMSAAEMAAYMRASRGLYGEQANPGLAEERRQAAVAESLELARLTDDRARIEPCGPAAVGDDGGNHPHAEEAVATGFGEGAACHAPELARGGCIWLDDAIDLTPSQQRDMLEYFRSLPPGSIGTCLVETAGGDPHWYDQFKE